MFRPLLPLLFACMCVLTGCSALSPNSDMTKLDIHLIGTDRLNPDINDRPSPVVIRLYELKSPVTFENSEFFSIYQHPDQALALDLVNQEELELRPGASRYLKLSVQPGSRYVGVLAAYRDLTGARWQQVMLINEGKRNRIELTFDERGIRTPDDAEDRP